MDKPKEQIDKWISELQHAVIVAGLNYDIWWVYKGKGGREKFVGCSPSQ